MKFQHYDLGSLRGGEVVEVTLSGSAANVRLLDSSNFQSFRSGRRHQFHGGHATRSPVRLQVPRSGHWHVVVDLGGYPGTIRSSVQVLPGALPRLNEIPLSSVPSLIRNIENNDSSLDRSIEFDVFISHASEDKEEVVRPLAIALMHNNLKVWYDEFELKIGDSLRRKIDQGLATSRFGIVVLSQSFLKKGWTNYELDGLVSRSVSGEQILLPIWHKITKNEVIVYSPSLADKVARNTSSSTIEEMAEEIARVIRDRSSPI